jgi:hypothetical protein
MILVLSGSMPPASPWGLAPGASGGDAVQDGTAFATIAGVTTRL